MNLNKYFERYARKHISVLRKGGEEALSTLYSAWMDEYEPDLQCTPREFLRLQSVDTLAKMLEQEANEGVIGEAVVVELESRDCERELKLMIKESDNDDVTMTCVEILERKNCQPEVDVYLDVIADSSRSVQLREELISLLKNYADAAAPYIFDRLDDANIELKTIFAEILICAQRDERTYELLNELFAYGDNIPLYCSYIGSYGDERLAGILYRALDKADYADFCEISNAIERLGGTVDYDMKDFTSDPTYQKIKDVNKNV
ncbi:MAG: hypothetical protein IJD07_03155 [Clostridia bacterium]|nr:hypothetical protein [Clostridia bacterium]